MDWVMNGINYGAIFGNTTLFPQTNNTNSNSRIKGQMTSNAKKSNHKTQTEYTDSYSKSQDSKKVTYEKPKSNYSDLHKGMNASGIQKGIELSDKAKALLDELREKYTNMEFRVAHWSTDEEEEYYASKCKKEFSVLIDPEALEKMAEDDSVKEKYLAALDQAGSMSNELKEELGDDFNKVDTFTISIDQDGKMSFTAKLVENFAKNQKDNAMSIKERLEQKKEDKIQEEIKRIKKDSLAELIAAIKEELSAQKEDEEA